MYVERRLFVCVDKEVADGAHVGMYNANGCALALAVYLESGAPMCVVHSVQGSKVDYSARTWCADNADGAQRNAALAEAVDRTQIAVRAFIHGWHGCTYAQELEMG